MKISILLCTHRYGGCDMLFESFKKQTFLKSEFEIVWSDKLYNRRATIVKNWAQENKINVIHFEPQNQSDYHSHNSSLNQCLEKATGQYTIILSDYTYMNPYWIDIHYQYNEAGYCLSAPQIIYGLPKLKSNLEDPFSTFYEEFNTKMFTVLPQFRMDPKLDAPNGTLVDHRTCYSRNESFPTIYARKIGGWDESYNGRTGPANIEFYVRLIYENNLKFVSDGRAAIQRIMSYPIPPFVKFFDPEDVAIVSTNKYNLLCKKYGVNP